LSQSIISTYHTLYMTTLNCFRLITVNR